MRRLPSTRFIPTLILFLSDKLAQARKSRRTVSCTTLISSDVSVYMIHGVCWRTVRPRVGLTSSYTTYITRVALLPLLLQSRTNTTEVVLTSSLERMLHNVTKANLGRKLVDRRTPFRFDSHTGKWFELSRS
ncbi:hypothetical protein EV363DRAFT_667266 [Boletus edulis]|nr:hypothetical protein EV363DRAFT_667266 [Boletus edulis]